MSAGFTVIMGGHREINETNIWKKVREMGCGSLKMKTKVQQVKL